MEKKRLTCIECPVGCSLEADIENCRVVAVRGNKCPRGLAYATAEVEHPVRILTSTVYAEGLELKMVPVRTDRPIPKEKLGTAMARIKEIRLRAPVEAGQVLESDLCGLGVNLIATRRCARGE